MSPPCLRRALRMCPASSWFSTSWRPTRPSSGCATPRGLQLGRNEARRRYDQAAKVDPDNLAAQAQLL
ncbi:hypothetical protein GCM10009682_29890 [Luedemannella flava]|uniref:Tetratricopeptide repeat protein n=1 Tax=Luedemannella flava TaxID=349316 RepID=A0ABP4YDD5_9ACTN